MGDQDNPKVIGPDLGDHTGGIIELERDRTVLKEGVFPYHLSLGDSSCYRRPHAGVVQRMKLIMQNVESPAVGQVAKAVGTRTFEDICDNGGSPIALLIQIEDHSDLIWGSWISDIVGFRELHVISPLDLLQGTLPPVSGALGNPLGNQVDGGGNASCSSNNCIIEGNIVELKFPLISSSFGVVVTAIETTGAIIPHAEASSQPSSTIRSAGGGVGCSHPCASIGTPSGNGISPVVSHDFCFVQDFVWSFSLERRCFAKRHT